MPAPAGAREHQVVFRGLEVLRLMGERIEIRHDVDGEDLQLVMAFMRDIAHRCLANTEGILRLASMEQNIANHQTAQSLFVELNDPAAMIVPDEFAARCRVYTNMLSRSIFEDRHCVGVLDFDLSTLSQFYEWEREVEELARTHSPMLHRLELKYTAPHCI